MYVFAIRSSKLSVLRVCESRDKKGDGRGGVKCACAVAGDLTIKCLLLNV